MANSSQWGLFTLFVISAQVCALSIDIAKDHENENLVARVNTSRILLILPFQAVSPRRLNNTNVSR